MHTHPFALNRSSISRRK